jgi:hypothetical protein
MSRFGLCRVGLTSQQNLAFYLWFAVVISPIPTPASSPNQLELQGLVNFHGRVAAKVPAGFNSGLP